MKKGFARVGWPNSGDLRPGHLGEGRLAKDGYSLDSLEENHRSYLIAFSKIHAGDLIIIPSEDGGGMVHLGIVLTLEKS